MNGNIRSSSLMLDLKDDTYHRGKVFVLSVYREVMLLKLSDSAGLASYYYLLQECA